MKIIYCKLAFIILLLFALVGCGFSVEEDNNTDPSHIYSRQVVNSLFENENYGYGKTEDVYVALKYIYDNKEIEKEYGSIFEANFTGGNADTGITFTSKKYTGNGKYFFIIDNDEWTVEVEKKFNEKWKVTKAYKSITNTKTKL